MSVLRLLSPSRPSGSRPVVPTLTLHVPQYGAIFMNRSIQQDEDEPRDDFLYRGELDIFLPYGSGRKRVRSISVGLKSVVKLDLGPMRRGEEDVLFERQVDITEGGRWLEEGMQRFDFTLIIPSNLAPHDWHHNGTIRHAIHAEVVGLETVKEKKGFKPGSRTPKSRSSSPGPSIEAAMAMVPPYDEEWLNGTFKIRRTVMILYNPHPTGGVSDLDERMTGHVDGLGPWELTMFADVFTICALMRTRITLPSLSPGTTVFAVRITFSQTHTITPPRGGETITSTRNFIIVEEGKRPKEHTGKEAALWRGVDAGGKGEGEYVLESRGRLPNDDHGRPSTLPGIVTPIKVSHTFGLDVFFSVYGETETGEIMGKPGPGGLRVLRVTRPVIVPSCALVPPVVNLPSYETFQNDTFSDNKKNIPCPLCGTKTHERLCRQCPDGTLPHPRHDHDPKLVGESGQCPTCSKNIMPDGNPTWRDCACGVGIEQMEERMQKIVRMEAEEYADWGGKEAMERGRRR